MSKQLPSARCRRQYVVLARVRAVNAMNTTYDLDAVQVHRPPQYMSAASIEYRPSLRLLLTTSSLSASALLSSQWVAQWVGVGVLCLLSFEGTAVAGCAATIPFPSATASSAATRIGRAAMRSNRA